MADCKPVACSATAILVLLYQVYNIKAQFLYLYNCQHLLQDSKAVSNNIISFRGPTNSSKESDIETMENMSPFSAFEHSGSVSVSERAVDKTAAIVMFVIGMLLGLSFFILTLRIFDETIRPKYFPSLPSFRSSTERVTRSSGGTPITPIERYRGLV
ncbi:hypothetical protein BELL_0147g00110 [Botrytis elliptica]|uniref:Uncharacterized protein n=1 Tax=Botrytis elliptica TaxID=278938 RepID=A0A4Z1K5G9_9HELO|nr:hypothetical protein BELL_0147g00110 [Botrytis elliptica]